jgi:sec-independent protein translocase protein TatC
VSSPTNNPDQFRMGLMEHLRELRKRLFYCAIFVLTGATASYSYAGFIFDLLCKPFFSAFPGSPLIGTAPAEAWFLKLKVSIFSGILITSPFLFYQLWRFVSPGLYRSEKRYVIPFVVLSTLLFSCGAYFCYSMVLPLSLSFFFDEFKSIGVTPTIRLSDHLSMAVTTIVGFGVVFELPLLAFFLTRAGVITHRTLIHYFRHSVVLIFVVAAILTPPDVLSQCLMAGPLVVLYVVSIGVALMANRSSVPETAT